MRNQPPCEATDGRTGQVVSIPVDKSEFRLHSGGSTGQAVTPDRGGPAAVPYPGARPAVLESRLRTSAERGDEVSEPIGAGASRRTMLRQSGAGVAAMAAASLTACAGAPGPSASGTPASSAGSAGTTPIRIPAGGRTLTGRAVRSAAGPAPRGLIFAVHGGGYTSRYFDVPGQSAMGLAAALGYDVVAVDRPGYAAQANWLLGFDQQAPVLLEAAAWARREYGAGPGQVFLYGHSIGGMLSLLMANAAPADFLGVSMTGSGAVYHDRALKGLGARLADPATGTHNMSPEAARRAVFMAPPWSYDMPVTRLDPERDVPSLVADLKDALRWPERLPEEARRSRVPVQFVVPEYDGLWRSDEAALRGVRGWFPSSPITEVRVQGDAGHSVELHHVWRAHVMKMLAFAEECRTDRARVASGTTG